MLSKNNILISIKFRKTTKEYLDKFCNMYKVSKSSFCQFCVENFIINNMIDNNRTIEEEDKFYQELTQKIKMNFDDRRK